MKLQLYGTAILAILSQAAAEYFQSGESNTCNQNLATKPCVSWQSKAYDLSQEVTIGCGECVEVTDNLIASLPKGMNIIGRLRIAPPAGKKVQFTTDHVVVQGLLSIDTPYAPVSDETVHFVMTNANDGQSHTFSPFGVNENMCGGSCAAGKRAVFVAGGRLDINGLPQGCKTWTQLESVSTVSIPENVQFHETYVEPAASCDDSLMSIDFESPVAHWYSKGTALFYVRNSAERGNYFEVTNRQVHWQGIAFDLTDEMTSCIVPDVTYQYSFYLKLHSNTGQPSLCAHGGGYCPSIAMNRRACPDSSCSNIGRGFGSVGAGFMTEGDDVWYPVSGTFKFTPEDLASGHYYRVSQSSSEV